MVIALWQTWTGSQCYCGNSLVGGTPATALTSDCSYACAGGASSTCSYWRIQIYAAPAATTSTTTSTATTSAPASTSTGWVLSNAGVSARILPGYTVTTSSLAPALCQSTCASKPYTISGVEAGSQ
ncbi:hypothetical protein B0H13DRAFT_1618602 [Mycena leptocephala]|nr:hypothetical protein B0H13DRAFT_1618602 [Mycena leptocephala]